MNLEEVIIRRFVEMMEDLADDDDFVREVLDNAELDVTIGHRNEVKAIAYRYANELSEYTL